MKRARARVAPVALSWCTCSATTLLQPQWQELDVDELVACEYCARVNEQRAGNCGGCGAPLPLRRTPDV